MQQLTRRLVVALAPQFKAVHSCIPSIHSVSRISSLLHNTPLRYFSSNSNTKRSNSKNDHEIIITDNSNDESTKQVEEVFDEHAYDRAFEAANDVYIDSGEISENIVCEIDKNDPVHPYVFQTRFGRVKYVQSLLPLKQQAAITKAYYLHNTISSNFLRKIMKSDSTNSLLIFSAAANYHNVGQIYASAKKMIEEFYYGTENKPRNPFRKCETPREIYNLSRRIDIEMKHFLSRICIIVSYDGQLRIKGTNTPQSQILSSHLGKQSEASLTKHDFIIPISHWQGIHSAEEYEHNGIPITQLSGKKIYPLYSVWPPTQTHYLKLFADYLAENKTYLRGIESAIDLGSGSGVLSFILAEAAPNVKVTAIDKNEAAVRCTGMNAAILNLSDRIKNEVLDFTKAKNAQDLIASLEKAQIPKQYDMIIANPPWVTTAPLTAGGSPLETANYDQKEVVLKSCFAFAQASLNRETKRSKKGRFLLIYSDLSEQLEIQAKDRIQALAAEYKLLITNTTKTKLSSQSLFRKNDPNYSAKAASSVILYEIQRI